jgi:Tfp pilus assembly PilM family ATPase
MNRNFTSITKNYFKTEFQNYIVVENGKTFYVPLDEANLDYQAIQKWIAEGNTVIDNGANN